MKSLLELNFPMSSDVNTLRFFVPLISSKVYRYCSYMEVTVVKAVVDEIIICANFRGPQLM